MNKTYTIIAGVVVVVLLVVVGWYAHGNHTSTALVQGIPGTGEPSGFDNVSLTGGLKVGVQPGDVSVPFGGVGSIYAYNGTVSGGVCSIVAAASTTVSIQLTASQIQGCSLISVTQASTTGTLALVLPASSTMTSMPNNGDTSQIYIYAASTTGNNLIIQATTTAGFAIGSIDGIASTTAASSTILAGDIGLLDIVRLPTTNMLGVISPTK